MVVYNQQARADLQGIFDGLSAWKTDSGQFYMTNEQITDYHNDILDICEQIDTVAYHARAKFPEHRLWGDFVYTYKRNARTEWYIIYNIVREYFIIEKIISNHTTHIPYK
jgi:hypothetical protein